MSDYKTAETVTITETKKSSKFKQHLRRYWWAYLLNFVIVNLITTLLLVYVALPIIAQESINKSEMYIDEQFITNGTPNSVQIKVVSRILNKSIFHPTLDDFDASLFLEDTIPNIKPFGQMNIPEVVATNVVHTTVDQMMQILDQGEFERYNVLVTKSETFRLAIRGRTKLRLGSLPVVTVDFNKVLELKGLNGLKGVTVKDIEISLLADADGNNMKGTLMIPNPSIMTLELGDVIQDISVHGQLIGNTTITNMVLRPGMNEIPMKSATDQEKILPLLINDPSKSGKISIEARTSSVIQKGQPLPYFTAAMSQIPVQLDLELKDAMNAAGLGAIFDSSPAL